MIYEPKLPMVFEYLNIKNVENLVHILVNNNKEYCNFSFYLNAKLEQTFITI